MQKLNNFIYMIAATVVANMVYFIDGILTNASATYYCRATTETYTVNRGKPYGTTNCSYLCIRLYQGDAYRESNGSCICTDYVTYTPEASEISHACGTIYSCSRDGYIAASVSTSGNAGYATYRDMGSGSMRLLGISCCPGAGTNGEVGPYVGDKVTAYPNVVVYSSGFSNITNCYVRRADLFMDDSGTFEHMYNCTYQSY